jgi:hypothetical protein
MSTMLQIQNFLSLAISNSIYPLIIEARTFRRSNGENRKNPPVFIYREQPITPDHLKKIFITKMLIPFDLIKNNFPAILTKWLYNTNLYHIYNLYCGACYNIELFIENKFINLTQALESYHRQVYDGKYQSDDEYHDSIYQEFKAIIEKNVHNANYRISLIKKIEYLNEYSYQKRLKEIFKTIPPKILSDLLGSVRKQLHFIKKIVEMRNHLTHFSKKTKQLSDNSKNLYYYYNILKIIIEICLLKESGLTWDEINKILYLNDMFKYYCSLQKNTK